jgi:hypothetical protein
MDRTDTDKNSTCTAAFSVIWFIDMKGEQTREMDENIFIMK